jgi:hypothetical protein
MKEPTTQDYIVVGFIFIGLLLVGWIKWIYL